MTNLSSIAVVDSNLCRGEKIVKKFQNAASYDEQHIREVILFSEPSEILSEIAALHNFCVISIAIEDINASSLINILRKMKIKSIVIGIYEKERMSLSFSFHKIVHINADMTEYVNIIQQLSQQQLLYDSSHADSGAGDLYVVSDNSPVVDPLLSHELLMSDRTHPSEKKQLGGCEHNLLDTHIFGDSCYEQHDISNDHPIASNLSNLSDEECCSIRINPLVPRNIPKPLFPVATNAIERLPIDPPTLTLPLTAPNSMFRQVQEAGTPPPWTNILAVMKLVVSMTHGTSDLCIRFVDDNFIENFKFSRASICGKCVEALVGLGTSHTTLNKVKTAVANGHSEGYYINLYRQDAVPLSCFVVVQVLSQSLPPQLMEGVAGEVRNAGMVFGTLTIRSASVVGNAKFNGMGPIVGSVVAGKPSNWNFDNQDEVDEGGSPEM